MALAAPVASPIEQRVTPPSKAAWGSGDRSRLAQAAAGASTTPLGPPSNRRAASFCREKIETTAASHGARPPVEALQQDGVNSSRPGAGRFAAGCEARRSNSSGIATACRDAFLSFAVASRATSPGERRLSCSSRPPRSRSVSNPGRRSTFASCHAAYVSPAKRASRAAASGCSIPGRRE